MCATSKRSEQPVGMRLTDTLCSAGWAQTVNLKLKGLPALFPQLADVSAFSVPHSAAIFYSSSDGPALACGAVAKSQLVQDTYNREETTLSTRLRDLLRTTRKLRKRAVCGVKRLIGHFQHVPPFSI